ncbi:long-chain fatty acid--CoA ligase [Rhodococcus sp. BP-149]|uniref:acyl-CoA synthetase n=1 Tax=unclassified Rhodococcus (in: high G+C Gram-positive bacteria) TaxID=192944 RepID=UPI001C9A58E7|nr:MULTISPECIES: long-chain fatty acid--CoA ligase [unclassified Rhodococcus (in: high G+C Gram-positive bacteria)]MBY6685648.1 long-chain fatty acid--CoA ligase [Rhodococcus sp. BP-288]MBY6694804.1 long-chain fatty acid--CoA ligase [Rhodococcus sp. BP-188]MBY6696650.1 long-chain fatty acid--CoA ligase [Rhodococcus sp. BP-285]MBY6703306.1 long-chain fatty acid--CoA ligase [Rhodococcus sp. BP-283]MBY6710740.1 long-chain fatty acid--CoA ligase [Rhodococcus sp. BP-160]
MRDHGVGSWIRRRVRQSPGASAIEFRGRTLSYDEVDDRTVRLAHVLRGLGVRRGDRVGILSSNHPAYLELLFSCGVLGAVFVPLNARLTAPEVAFAVEDSGLSVLVHSAELGDIAATAVGVSGVRRIVLDDEYDTLVAGADSGRIDEAVGGADPCFIMYTSGTTGRPKGVVMSHDNVLFAVLNAILDLDLCSDEVALVCAPLFHTAALDMVALPILFKGGVVIVEEGFDAGRVLDIVESRSVTYTFGVPTILDSLVAHSRWAETDLTSLRRIVVAAAPVPPRTLRAYAERGVTMCQGYGLTESGPGATILASVDAERKVGTAGVPHTFTDVRIVDGMSNPVPAGERGEIQIQGPNVMTEYWGRPDATAEVFDDGWLRTGDIGIADAEGFITIVDRLKDMIISGGENIYPAEIEAALLDLPGVESCAVFGVPDPRWGESAVAAVTFTDAAEMTIGSLADALGGRIARYKLPKRYVLVDDIPRNPTGKIRKDLLRERYSESDAGAAAE